MITGNSCRGESLYFEETYYRNQMKVPLKMLTFCFKLKIIVSYRNKSQPGNDNYEN